MRDNFSVDLDALTKILQVWRGIKPSLVTRRLKNTGDHGSRGSLAFGSGNMDNGVFLLWITQQMHQVKHALKIKFGGSQSVLFG
ncbi:hypothetical protein SDC9_146397 [bioreactor metagenome]|uniref:Uncharacterized protein n=1 Tax=bioreactor metagenome TaxID=1076179 RepID=A0A645EBZ5_9ZZZZ